MARLAVFLGNGLILYLVYGDGPGEEANCFQAQSVKTPSPAKGFKGRQLIELLRSRRHQDGGGAGGDPCVECRRGALACGPKVAGSLSAEDCQLQDESFIETWSLEVKVTVPVQITLSSPDFDPFLFIADADSCLVLDENDDCPIGELPDSCLFLLLPPGNYLVAANTYLGGKVGNYTLKVACKLFHRGDADNSGAADITDGIAILEKLFLGGNKVVCQEAADVDDSGVVDITDPITLLTWAFLGGPPPANPGPPGNPCGPDPNNSPSDLGCKTYDKC